MTFGDMGLGPQDGAIEVISWPPVDLAALIDKVRDARILIGLMRLEREMRAAG